MKKIYLILMLFCICNVAMAYTWQPIPIRTKAQQTAGFSGGEAWQVPMDRQYAPSNPNIVYQVTDTSQVWKSINGGESWVIKKNGFMTPGGRAIVVDPNDENHVLVAASHMAVYQDHPEYLMGIYRTTNGGNNWTLVKECTFQRLSANERGYRPIVFSGSNIYAGPEKEGLLKSTNGGATWTNVKDASNNSILLNTRMLDLVAHPTDSTILYITTPSGIKKISGVSGTATVTNLGSGLPAYPVALRINPDNSNMAFAMIPKYGIYRSTNFQSSATFSPINTGKLQEDLNSGYTAHYIAMSPADPNYLYVHMMNMWIVYTHNATSGTPTWSRPASSDVQNADGWVVGSLSAPWSAPEGDWGATPIAVHPTDKNIAIAKKQANKTTDGGANWRPWGLNGFYGATVGVQPQYSDVQPIAWDINNPNRYILNIEDFGPYITENGGTTFRPTYIPTYVGMKATNAGALDPTLGSNIYVTGVGDWSNKKIAITRNINSTTPSWQLVNGTEVSGVYNRYTFIAFNPNNPNIVYAGRFKFTNIQSNNNFVTLSRRVVAMYPGNGNIVYSLDWGSGKDTTIYKSTDAGQTWSDPGYPKIPQGHIGEVTIHPTNPDKIYVAKTYYGIYIIDGSVTPKTITLINDSNGLTRDAYGELKSHLIAIDPNNPNVLYTSSWHTIKNTLANGVFRSTDGGNTWTNITGNIGPNLTPASLTVNPHDSYIYVGSGQGTWKYFASEDPGTGTGGPPLVVTGTATAVTSNSATQNATINPNNGTTTARWQYGTQSGNYQFVTGSVTVGNGTASVDVSTSTTSLGSNIPYYVRCQANNGSGTTNGSETTFTTLASRLSSNAIKTGTNTITVDGDISEWPTLTNNISKTITGTPLSNGTWSARWIDGVNGGLYVAVSISDATFYADTGSTTPYNDDAYEIYIDRDNNKNTAYDSYDRQFVNAPNSTFILANTEGTNTGVLIGNKLYPGSRTAEMFIPWSNFTGGSIPGSGTVVGFDVQLNDDNGTSGASNRAGAKDWNNTVNTNYFNTSNFGELILVGTTTGSGGTETIAPAITQISNCIAYWPMNELSGSSTADISGNGYNGTVTNNAVGTTTAKFGGARYLDGINDKIVVLGSLLGNPANLTISAWVKLTAYDTNGASIISLGDHIGCGFDLTGTHTGFYYENPSWKNSYGNTMYNHLNKWEHFIFVMDDSNNQQYLFTNANISSGTSTFTTSISYTGLGTSTIIGAHGNGGTTNDFEGYIDDLRIYNRVLTNQEILDLTTIGSVTIGVGTPTSITQTSAIFKGTTTPNGSSTFNGYFRHGTTIGGPYTGTSTEQLIGTGTTPVTLSRTITGLSPNTTYYLVPVAYNAAGIHIVGSETSFSTLGADVIAPVGTITINSSGTYTISTAITLNLTATDAVGVEGYLVSMGTTTPTATDTAWVVIATTTAYSANIPYTLSSVDGTKTVYCWFKDGVGNISAIAQDSIILDLTSPSIAIMSPVSNCTFGTSTLAFGTTTSTVDIAGSSTDTNGVVSVVMRNSGTSSIATVTGTESFSFSAPIITNVVNTIDITSQDSAGNQGTTTMVFGAFPTVSTTDATLVTRNSAQLNGTGSANLNTSTVWYDYGLYSGEYTGSSTTIQVTGSTDTSINISLGALNRNIPYYYRLSGSNTVSDNIHGNELNFTTLGGVNTEGRFTTTGHFFTTEFIQFLKDNELYKKFFKTPHLSTQDLHDLKVNPDDWLSNLQNE